MSTVSFGVAPAGMKVVLDASTLIGALLKERSVPEQALLLSRSHATICLSRPVEDEIRQVFARPKFRKYLAGERAARILDLLTSAAMFLSPVAAVEDCRDPNDNKYLELALAADADLIISSDADLLALDPWRGVRILRPAEYVALFEASAVWELR